MNCPKCNSASKQRVKRTGIQRLFKNGRRYKCMLCNRKYFQFTYLDRIFKV